MSIKVICKSRASNVLKLLNLNCLFVSGFIDYIVLPTLTVIGDSHDLNLGTLDIPPNFDFLRGFFQIFLSKKSPIPPTFPCKEKKKYTTHHYLT